MKTLLIIMLVAFASPAFAFCDVGQDVGDYMECTQDEQRERDIQESLDDIQDSLDELTQPDWGMDNVIDFD